MEKNDEENKNLNQELELSHEGSSSVTPEEKQVVKKSHKKILLVILTSLLVVFVVVILLGLFVIPNLNPEEKFSTAVLNKCKEECVSSEDIQCTNKCLEINNLSEFITPIKVTSTPTASPTPTFIPNPTEVESKTQVKTIVTPTPQGNPTLIVKVKVGINTVTLENQNTGQVISESISSPGKNYYIDPGAYRITFNEVANCKAAYAVCYENCGFSSGNWGSDQAGSTVNINVEVGKTHAVSLFQADPDSPNNPFLKCKALQ